MTRSVAGKFNFLDKPTDLSKTMFQPGFETIWELEGEPDSGLFELEFSVNCKLNYRGHKWLFHHVTTDTEKGIESIVKDGRTALDDTADLINASTGNGKYNELFAKRTFRIEIELDRDVVIKTTPLKVGKEPYELRAIA